MPLGFSVADVVVLVGAVAVGLEEQLASVEDAIVITVRKMKKIIKVANFGNSMVVSEY